MLKQDIRFHLQPMFRRASLETLQNREQAYLRACNTSGLGLPSPHAQLRLVTVIPAFNEEGTIGEVLQSLCAQDLPSERMEVLVIDNGSCDGTAMVVSQCARSSAVPIHLLSERRRGCLQALRTGMDMGLRRLAQVAPPMQGVLAVVDADDRVGPSWASAFLEAEKNSRADMMRGRTQTDLPSQVEGYVKVLCDLENRVFAYAELARLRMYEAVIGTRERSLPLWLPRITGPNVVITRAAYVAVGGLDPRPPGDQASHLANPLLRLGGSFVQCDDSRLTLFRSNRESRRAFGQAAGFGVGFGVGFGDMISRASAAVHQRTELDYPNPTWMEAGLRKVLTELDSEGSSIRRQANEFVKAFLESPTDPSALYRYGSLSARPDRISASNARARLIEMTQRAGGMDYRAAERFLVAKEHLRQELLSYEGELAHSAMVVDGLLERISFPVGGLPSHVEELIGTLRVSPDGEKSHWFDAACRVLEQIYARMQLD